MTKGRSLRLIVAAAALSAALLCRPASAAVHVYVNVAPPPLVVETRSAVPGHGYVWIGGFHRWDGRAYVWVPGRWALPPHHHTVWVEGHWKHSHHGWYWVDGRWK